MRNHSIRVIPFKMGNITFYIVVISISNIAYQSSKYDKQQIMIVNFCSLM